MTLLASFTLGAATLFVTTWALMTSLDHAWFEFHQAFALELGASLVVLGGLGAQFSRKLSRTQKRARQLAGALQSAQAGFADNEKRFRQMVDALPQAAWVANAFGNIVWLNQAWRSYSGTGAELAQSRAWEWDGVLHPEDLPRCTGAWTASVTTGKSFEMHFRFRRAADGMYRWHHARAIAVQDPSGQATQWFGTCTDIHALKEAGKVVGKAVEFHPAEEFKYAPSVGRDQ